MIAPARSRANDVGELELSQRGSPCNTNGGIHLSLANRGDHVDRCRSGDNTQS